LRYEKVPTREVNCRSMMRTKESSNPLSKINLSAFGAVVGSAGGPIGTLTGAIIGDLISRTMNDNEAYLVCDHVKT
jgi:hypothetical protein